MTPSAPGHHRRKRSTAMPSRTRLPRWVVVAIGLPLLLAGGLPPQCGDKARSGPHPQRTVEVYDPATDSWTRGPRMPLVLSAVAAREHAGRIYVTGQGTEKAGAAVFLRLDPATGVWTTPPAMAVRRSSPGLVAVGTDLYLIGGVTPSGDTTGSVEVFDTVTETWSPGPGMLTPRSAFGATALGGLIYVVGGGSDQTRSLADVEVLDTSSGIWQALRPLPALRRSIVAETDGSRIYAMGGAEADLYASDVYVYDPGSDTWSAGPSLPSSGLAYASSVIGGEFYVVLWIKSRRRLVSLDPVTGLGTRRASGRKYVNSVGAAASGGLLYVFGGFGP